jgi:hypothetical protein
MIRVLLITLALAGCSILPETPPAPSTALADHELTRYETGEVEPFPAVDLPDHQEGEDGSLYWVIDFEAMEKIDAALAVGEANTQALAERNRQIETINFERDALLRAGRLAEYQASLYHQLWSNEIRQGWIDSMVCRGVTGGALLFLAAGAL